MKGGLAKLNKWKKVSNKDHDGRRLRASKSELLVQGVIFLCEFTASIGILDDPVDYISP